MNDNVSAEQASASLLKEGKLINKKFSWLIA